MLAAFSYPHLCNNSFVLFVCLFFKLHQDVKGGKLKYYTPVEECIVGLKKGLYLGCLYRR